MSQTKITELEQWLQDNPNHPDRTTIEADLRRLIETEISIPVERDTFDFRNYNIYDV